MQRYLPVGCVAVVIQFVLERLDRKQAQFTATVVERVVLLLRQHLEPNETLCRAIHRVGFTCPCSTNHIHHYLVIRACLGCVLALSLDYTDLVTDSALTSWRVCWLVLGADRPSRQLSLGDKVGMSTTSWLMGHRETELSEQQRSLHTYVIGQTGMGKSKAMETWIIQDILAGRGVGVIDPHGDLFNHLIAWLAKHPEFWRKVILVDPTDPTWTIAINPLEATDRALSERLALFMTDICVKLWRLETSSAPRLIWLLTNTFLALSSVGLTVVDLPRFLADSEFRSQQLNRTTLNTVRTYFEHEFPKTERGVHQWIAPVLNKLGTMLFDPDVSVMFAGKNTLDFRSLIDHQMILLVNLPKGILSEGLSSLVAALLVGLLQKAALSRADSSHRSAFYLYLDEFQHYTTDNITDVLTESRKYRLSLTLAHQYLDQVPAEIKQAVLNTAGNLVCFRVGLDDARVLAKEIFLSSYEKRHVEPHFHLRHRGIMAFPHLEKTTADELARELAILPARQFWYRRRGLSLPVKEISLWLPDPQMTPGLKQAVQELRDFSGSRFGHRKDEMKKAQKPYFDQQDLPLWTA